MQGTDNNGFLIKLDQKANYGCYVDEEVYRDEKQSNEIE
jgi:hypothetical protein